MRRGRSTHVVSDKTRDLRRSHGPSPPPHQEARTRHLLHPHRSHHPAVPRIHRAHEEPRHGDRRRFPRDGLDAHAHQVQDAPAAAREPRGRRGRRRPARRAHPAAARVQELQGGRGLARAAGRDLVEGLHPRDRDRRPNCRPTTSRCCSTSTSSTCWPRSRTS